MFTKPFNKISKKDTKIAGGKGASLGELTNAGIVIPNGFVILAEAFEEFLKANNLTKKIKIELKKVKLNEPQTIEIASKTIQTLILKANTPKKIENEIKKYFKKLDAEFVAVRSSATAEDSLTDTWAGQLDTFLNTTEETLLENVKKCWASLFTPRAIFYRFEKKLDKKDVSVAVVIQKMIVSEKSGIAFSVHPITEDRNQILIEAGFGLGEAIVSGSITPDSYVVEKEPMRIIDKNISIQNKKFIYSGKGENKWVDLSKVDGGNQVLTEEQILKLSELILKIENHYNSPQDIEWAQDKAGKFYITQSRPITTLRNFKINERERDSFLGFVKSKKFYRQIAYSFIPVIYFESTMRSYIDNPLQKKLGIKKFPNVIEILKDKFEGWDDQKIQKITNREKIEFVIEESRSIINKYNKSIDDILKTDYLRIKNDDFVKSVKLLDQICTEVYQRYIFFIHEFFETNDEDLLKLLPEVRIELSEFVDKIYQSCDIFIKNLDEKFENVSKDFLWHSSFEDLIFLLENPEKVDGFKKRINKKAIIFIYDNNKLHTIKNQKDIKSIIEILEKQKEKIGNVGEIKGKAVFKGKSKGRVVKLLEKDYLNAKDILEEKEDYILVTPMTRPEIVQYMKRVSAIITDEGGITCYASIVAREMKKPCIIGTKIATQVLKDGDLVEVDADDGVVRILKKKKNIISVNHSDYQHFTQTKGKVFFRASYGFIYHIKDLEGLVLYDGSSRRTFISKKRMKKSLEDGSILYAKKNFLDKLERGIKENFDKSLREIENIEKNGLTKKGLIDFVEYIDESSRFYRYTDFFYTDKYFFTHKLSKSFIKKFEKIKLDGRYCVNETIYKNNSLVNRMIVQVSKKFNIDKKLILEYSMPEIFLLFDGMKVDKSVIIERKKAHVLYADESEKIKMIFGNNAMQFIKSFDKEKSDSKILKGTVASPGVADGRAHVIHIFTDDFDSIAKARKNVKKGEILVTDSTIPEIIDVCNRVSAIITNQGGMMSHAAIVARELHIPCIVGVENATDKINTGDMLMVDASQGIIKILNKKIDIK